MACSTSSHCRAASARRRSGPDRATGPARRRIDVRRTDQRRSHLESRASTDGRQPSPAVRWTTCAASWASYPTPTSGSATTLRRSAIPHEPITLDGLATSILGEWFLLGERAIDEVVASLPGPAATVGRLWPEHFDYGIDLAAAPLTSACNLGAAAGDAFHAEPYLYVGPWGFADGSLRRGVPWTALEAPTSGTRRSAHCSASASIDAADDPIRTAIEFFMTGIAALRSVS